MGALTKKQKAVLDFIRDYSRDNGISPTQGEIKRHFGLKSFGSVQRYIQYLVRGGHLLNAEGSHRGLMLPPGPERNVLEVPLVGDVAAGIPGEAVENPGESLPVPAYMCRPGHHYFALRVQGESMIEDGILENDVVVCRGQATAYQGQTVVAVLEGEATLKRFYRRTGWIELHPANITMSPIKVQGGDFRIVGVMVGLLRSYV